ncbi:MAG: trypsin-like peptidase domain-containing protein [Hamadaea sp.]|nr:trypsin-like peptidase domain-containing protein [Hamadaea sp.]NUR49763.1 trypsin-like peptidase domain-containing protein [Hamadaea sp.]NUT06593.1 trypsin-like peptidase domain-containing protein [Hamadaea sp.]
MTGQPTLPGRVRVLAGDPERIVGAGVALSARRVLTCWHVVSEEAADGLAVAEPSGVPVEVDVTWSVPIGPHGEGDLALLTTRAPLAGPPARLADCGDAELDVRLIGHPAQSPAQVLARARLIGPADPVTGWRQLDRLSTATVAVDRGFSGAGVFDAAGRIVGLTVARSQLGQQTVGWMIPVAAWRRQLPRDLVPAVAAAPRTEPLSAAERSTLARALAAVPTMLDPLARAELIAALPDAIRLRVRVTHRLLLDCRELLATTLDTDGGFAALHRRLSEREDPDSISMREFRALAVSMRLLPPPDEED